MKKILSVIVVALALFAYIQNPDLFQQPPQTEKPAAEQNGDTSIDQAFKNKISDVQVKGSGVASRILPDDNEGSRHQKFILKLSSGLTVLISHNIDLAPRINTLKKGDTVTVYGEYEWSSRGGVVHWTHHDPNGRHEDGWIKHKGKLYQ